MVRAWLGRGRGSIKALKSSAWLVGSMCGRGVRQVVVCSLHVFLSTRIPFLLTHRFASPSDTTMASKIRLQFRKTLI